MASKIFHLCSLSNLRRPLFTSHIYRSSLQFRPRSPFTTIVEVKKDLDARELTIEKTRSPKTLPVFDNTLLFGTAFSDHMLVIDYEDPVGWCAPKIVPFQNFSLSPAATVFHYALEAFEGCKAYIDPNTKQIRTFRIDENIDRMLNSCEKLVMPLFNKQAFHTCLKEFLKVEKRWIPDKPGFSLYVRPTIIGTSPKISVTRATSVRLFVITCPVGPYYPTGFAPVKLLASDKYVRAWPGGCGAAKLGSNYGPTIYAQMEAEAQGCQQVIWLFNKNQGGEVHEDGRDDYVTEVGSMNLFFFWKNEQGQKELITAPLDGTILPGITRKSILELSREWNEFKVTERAYTIKEVIQAAKDGRLIEAFGSGTAAVVSPVNKFVYRGKEYDIPCESGNEKVGELTMRFWKTITDIQYGAVQHPWSQVVD